jgi:hypothetical protein
VERIVATRLSFHLESRGLLTPYQAGFRKKRSTEDQLIRLSQNISDAFQKNPMNRTVLALIDYSKAYDTVWKDGLLWKMVDKGLCNTVVRWTQGWLTNRLAFVTYGDSSTDKTLFRQGIPQGSVIAPLLFLLYIDDIAALMPTGVLISLFADDVAVYSSNKSLVEAEREVQSALNIIARWSEKWKLTISIDKCEASFFSTWSREAKWIPTLKINGTVLKYSQNPTFLGLTYDRQLTFAGHASATAKKVTRRSRALLHLGGTDWGYEKKTLKTTYVATSRSLIE